jgi:hypothetical protein
MPITISNLTIGPGAPAGTIVGVLTARDVGGTTDISERNHGSGGTMRSRMPYTLAKIQNVIDWKPTSKA